MHFRAGEIDDAIWEDEAEEGKVQPWIGEAEAEGEREEDEYQPEGLTLIDARNGFNELSRYSML